MSKTRLRGGVTATSPDDPGYALNNPDEWDIVTRPDGSLQIARKPGFWTKAMPYIWGAAMTAGLGANAGLFGELGAAGGGSSAVSTTAPGLLASSSVPGAVEAGMTMGPTGAYLPAGGNLAGGGGGMNIPGWLKNFVGGGDSGGLDIADLIKLIGATGGIKDLLGLNDEDAEWATFENESRGGRSLDPRDLMAQGLQQTERAGMAAGERAKTPVRLRSSYVQQPPQFVGGGLPMPIGLTGQDPGLTDPSLLSAEGALSDNPFDEADAALEMLRSRG